jgi:hypothetical protein
MNLRKKPGLNTHDRRGPLSEYYARELRMGKAYIKNRGLERKNVALQSQQTALRTPSRQAARTLRFMID